MSEDQVQPFFLDRHVLCNGTRTRLDMKVSVFTDPDFAAWDLKRVIVGLGHNGANPIKDWTKHQLPKLKVILTSLGLEPPEILPSRKSLSSQGVPVNEWSPFARCEFQVDTRGLLKVILASIQYKRGSSKQTAQAWLLSMFSEFLEGGLGSDDWAQHREDMQMVDGSTCQVLPGSEVCVHFQTLRSFTESLPHPTSPQALAHYLIELVRPRGSCPSVSHWLERTVAIVASAVEVAIAEVMSDDPLRASLLDGRQKRRRVDEDLKRAACLQVRRFGLASSTAVWARATGKLPGSSAGGLRDSCLKEYIASSHEGFVGCKGVRVVLDGARVGEPPAELLVGLVVNTHTGLAVWSPPQALRIEPDGL